MKTALPMNLEKELERAGQLLEDEKYQKALKLLKELDREFPEDEEVILLLAECYHLVDDADNMRRTLLDAMKLWPDWFELPQALADYLLEDDLPEEAEIYFRQALSNDPRISNADLSFVHTGLGAALWGQHKRDDALDAWKHALELDPDNEEADELLALHTNEYNEPASPSPMFDDLHHFRNIHMERYYELKGDDVFSSESEANEVVGRIMLAWNEHIAPLGASIDDMPAKQKTKLFESVKIDFPKPHPSSPKKPKAKKSDKADDTLHETPGEQRFFRDLEKAFPFIDPEQMALLFTVGIPILDSAGFTAERLFENLHGSPVNEDEKERILWAWDLFDIIVVAERNKGRKKEIELILKAKDIACEVLDEDEALAVINDVRKDIEKTFSEAREINRSR
jgi:tetratricopeptide (TPR) repeat protein